MRISDWSSDVCSSDLEIFAQGNVSLVDLKHDPIVRVVTSGIETASALIECDIIVFATGFDAGSGGLIDMKLRGTEGFDLGEAWKDGVRAYLGYSVTGFPNMLFHYGPLSPSGFSNRSEEHTSELQSLMRISYAVFCLKKK